MKKLSVVAFLALFIGILFYDGQVHARSKSRADWESAGIVWHIATKEKWVALTFDDGPYPKYTREILNILDQYHAKGTFFVVGKMAERYPELLREMQKRGHEIANHTYRHPRPERISMKQLQREIAQTDQIIYNITGVHPHLFRPPGGVYSDKVMAAANKYKVIMYSKDPKDWADTNKEEIVNQVCTQIHPGDIVLLHDFGSDRTNTITALEEIMENLYERGYTLVTVSELLRGKRVK